MRRGAIGEIVLRTALLLLGLVGLALLAGPGSARAGMYKVVLCSGTNADHGPAGSTSTPSIDLGEHCSSPDGDPPGNSAFLSIHESQASGTVANGAVAEYAWTAPAWTHFRQAGGYTREPAAFNPGWRARLVGTNLDGSTFLSMNQGYGVVDDGGGVNAPTTSNFAPHLWPFGTLRDFNRFAFRLECVRSGGCDPAGLNDVDANGFVFALSDDFDSRIAVTNGGTPFMSGQWVRGTQPVNWTVTEYGSGLRLMRVAVDGANDVVYDYGSACETQTTVSNGLSGRSFAPCVANNGSFAILRDVQTGLYPDGERVLSICSQDFGQWQGFYGSGGETCDRRTVRIDNTAPVAPSNLVATGRNRAFGASWANPPQEGVAPIAASHYRLQQLSGGAYDSGIVRVAGGPGMQSLDGLPAGSDGGYRLTVYLEDAAGNANPSNTAIQNFVIDSAAPETSITEGPAHGSFTTARAANFRYVSGDPAAAFECSLDGAAFSTCGGSGSDYAALPDGTHSFRVRAVNANGPDPTPAERIWTVDNVAPTASIRSGPGAGETVRPSAVSFGFTADESPVSFECRFDGQPFTARSPPEAFPATADGTHTFAVRATDAAGNRGAPAERSFVVDGRAPVTSITDGPSSGSTINTNSPSFSFSSDEPGSALECRVDDGPFVPCVSPHRLAGLADGPHVFEARATDPAGTLGSPAARSFTVDTARPDVTLTAGPVEGATVRPALAAFAFVSADPAATFECRLDGGPFSPCASPDGRPGIGDGAHTFMVRALDPAGNRSEPAARSFTVDGTGPVTRFTGGPAGGSTIRRSSAEVSFTANEPGSAFACSLDSGPLAACSSPYSLTGLPDGPHTLTVQATDQAGNSGPLATLTFAVDTSPPPPAPVRLAPNDPRHCALQAFRARMTRSGLRVVMRSEVPRLVRVQLFRRTGGIVARRPMIAYRKLSQTGRTVRFVPLANLRISGKVRAYVRRGRRLGAVVRIVPRVINEVRGCNEGGRIGSRTEVGYRDRFTRRVRLSPVVGRR